MSFYEMLKMGRTIKIEDPRGEDDPARFWIKAGKLFSWCPAIGNCDRTDMTPERLNAHMERMIKEGYSVTIH